MKRFMIAILMMAALAGSAHAQTIFTGQLLISPTDWDHQKTIGARVTRDYFGDLFDWTFTTGTNADQMATLVVNTITLTNAASQTVDVSALTNSFGDAVSFKAVRLFGATAPAANTNAIEIQSASSNGWASMFGTATTNGAMTVRAGGTVFAVAPDLTGYAVATNAHRLTVLNVGTNPVSVTLYIAGSE